MSIDSGSDYKRTVRVKVSHPDVEGSADGSLTYGYGCLAHLRIDWRGPELRLTPEQLATGLLAVAENGHRLSLFNCEQNGQSLYPEFVTEGELRDADVVRFEVRYTDVSEWFFQQMAMHEVPGKNVEWREMPPTLVAEVSQPSHHFKVESFYVGTIAHQGEDRNLHQHFEFRFTATRHRFTLADVKQQAHQFSNLLSILLAHPCSIVSVDVYADDKYGAHLYYPVSRTRRPAEDTSGDIERISFRSFFTLKSDLDPHWGGVVKKFFASEYRGVIWSRLAGMQHHDGFWEHRVLGYVTLLDGYVSQRIAMGKPMLPPKQKRAFAQRLGSKRLALTTQQQETLMEAVTAIFSQHDTFASKFEKLIEELDADVYKIIKLSADDFRLIKLLRNQVVHGLELSFKERNLTPVLVIVNRIELLLTHLFFLEVDLGKDVFLRGLERPLNRLRRESEIDEVHLARVLKPGNFLKMTPYALLKLRKRPKLLFICCVTRSRKGTIVYSRKFSEDVQNKPRARQTIKYHEILGLPEEAVTFLGNAYFENGSDIERVHSTVMIDLALLPA